MAKGKKVTISENPFAKTDRPAQARMPVDAGAPSEPQPAQIEPGNKVRAVSVSLRESEYAAFDEIAASLAPASTRMAVMNEALRIFLRAYKAGGVKIKSDVEGGRVIVRESK